MCRYWFLKLSNNNTRIGLRLYVRAVNTLPYNNQAKAGLQMTPFILKDKKILSGPFSVMSQFMCSSTWIQYMKAWQSLELSPIRTDVHGTLKTWRCHTGKIMIVCLDFFQDVTGTCWHKLTQTSIATPPSLSMHTTVYPMNSFTIYNYLLFSVIYKQEHSNKGGIKLGLLSRSKNKKTHYICFPRVSKKPHHQLFIAGNFPSSYLFFQLRTKPY